MSICNKLFVSGLLVLLLLAFTQIIVWAEEANNNIVIVAGETWGTYTPPNVDYAWPLLPYNNDFTGQSSFLYGIFRTNRLVTSGLFGNPPWGWMGGYYAIDFGDAMWALEFNPTDEFAAFNKDVEGTEDKNYAVFHYNRLLPGADDPERNYHDPVGGGANLSADRTHAWSTSAWPTNLGVDIKMTVHSWTLPWGHLDDFHLCEIEFYNTGEADINGDGNVDLHGNEIHALCLYYYGSPFGFAITNSGTRDYWQPNSRFRGMGNDMTPDDDGFPYDISIQGYGSDAGTIGHPGLGHYGTEHKGFYYDAYQGHTYLGAKKLDTETNTWEEKFLCFKDANGDEIVPAIGEGVRRGWFRSCQPEYDIGDGTLKNMHNIATGCFFVDGGKAGDISSFDLRPNPALFESGVEGDITTFVVKDPSQWEYPDGAYEYAESIDAIDPVSGANVGRNPMDTERAVNKPLEPGIITEGLITEFQFNGSMANCLGPFSMKVGERIRLYFVRGSGFRIAGLRKTMNMARAVFNSIQSDGSYVVPQSPPVPEIKISGSTNVRPLIKWQDPSSLGDFDGIKIYKSVAWPRFDPMTQGFPEHDTWWKTMNPDVRPDPIPYNPLFNEFDLVFDQPGGSWGPYDLIKVIDKDDFADYANTTPDAGEYPYAWEDETYSSPGQTYWFYVSTYKESAANTVPLEYAGLDDGADWLESGKVNFNGRTGLWEGSWPWSELHYNFPEESDVQARKDIGARYILVSPPADLAQISLGKLQIGIRPNPYKRAAFHDVNIHQLMFYNLPERCDISIYDLAGMLIDKIEFQAPTSETGVHFWDMHSKNGNEVASGLYIWVAEFDGGQQMGKFAIIR